MSARWKGASFSKAPTRWSLRTTHSRRRNSTTTSSSTAWTWTTRGWRGPRTERRPAGCPVAASGHTLPPLSRLPVAGCPGRPACSPSGCKMASGCKKKSPAPSLLKMPGKYLAATYSHRTCRPNTIGAAAFHFRVRNGTGWFHRALVTRGQCWESFGGCRRIPGLGLWGTELCLI